MIQFLNRFVTQIIKIELWAGRVDKGEELGNVVIIIFCLRVALLRRGIREMPQGTNGTDVPVSVMNAIN